MGAKIVGKFRILYGAKTSKKIARITAEATEKRLVGSIRARKCLKIVPAFFSNFDPSAESERRISGDLDFAHFVLIIDRRKWAIKFPRIITQLFVKDRNLLRFDGVERGNIM